MRHARVGSNHNDRRAATIARPTHSFMFGIELLTGMLSAAPSERPRGVGSRIRDSYKSEAAHAPKSYLPSTGPAHGTRNEARVKLTARTQDDVPHAIQTIGPLGVWSVDSSAQILERGFRRTGTAASPEPAAGCRHQPAANQPHHHQRCDPSLCAALSLCVPCVRAAEQASSSRLSRGTDHRTPVSTNESQLFRHRHPRHAAPRLMGARAFSVAPANPSTFGLRHGGSRRSDPFSGACCRGRRPCLQRQSWCRV